MSLTTLIVDDEALARDELAFLLRDFPEVEVIGTGSNGLEAVDLIQKLEPDLVFLDVQMPGLDGLAVVRRLRADGVDLPHIIFATAYDNYAIEAFRLEAMDYLLKPVEKERLGETIERARRAMAERAAERGNDRLRPSAADAQARMAPARSKLVLLRDGRQIIIDAGDLVYATIDSGDITLVALQGEGRSTYKTIEDLQGDLDPEVFWRVHRKYLVNTNRIKEVVPWFKSSFQLRMEDKKASEIPVSRVQTKRLREMLKL